MRINPLLIAISLTLPTATPAFAEAQGQQEPDGKRIYMLPIETKDPYASYVMGLFPYNSFAAARYVGTTRTNSEIPPHLEEAARSQLYTDLGLTAGAAVLGAVLGGVFYSLHRADRYANNSMAQFDTTDTTDGAAMQAGIALGVTLPMLCIPIAHWLWYGPYWEKAATEFNKAQLKAN